MSTILGSLGRMFGELMEKPCRWAPNYRKNSIIECCIISRMSNANIVVSNIMRHLDQQNILTDSQHGFRVRRSCETQLISLIRELALSLDKKKQHDIAVLDFSKAFDRVPHERMLAKLQHYGVKEAHIVGLGHF